MEHVDANCWTIRPPDRTSWRFELYPAQPGGDTSVEPSGATASLTRISWAKALVAQLIARG